MPEPAGNPLSGRLISALLALLTAAFLSWSAVVWRGVQVVEDTIATLRTEMRMMQQREHLSNQMRDRYMEELHQHMAAPWHGQAGNELSRIRAELEAIRREMEARPRGTYPNNMQ